MPNKKEKIQRIKKEIGARIREIRETLGETGPAVAARATTDKGLISNLEQGKANPTLDVFLPVITEGLKMEWADFCSYFVGDQAERQREEREARQLFEQLLLQSTVSRRDLIGLLRSLGFAGGLPPDTE